MLNLAIQPNWRYVRRRARAYADAIELAALHRIIRLNRVLRRARTWLDPILPYAWILPVAFVVGAIVGLWWQMA